VKGLIGKAAIAWDAFSAKFPGAVMTSGARTLEDQARVMAPHVVRDRRWVAKTYRQPLCAVARALQLWSDAHPKATEPEIVAGFTMVMRRFSAFELAKLTRHVARLAFDVLPVAGELGAAMKDELRDLARRYGGLFLDHEGADEVWHLQFDPEPEAA